GDGSGAAVAAGGAGLGPLLSRGEGLPAAAPSPAAVQRRRPAEHAGTRRGGGAGAAAGEQRPGRVEATAAVGTAGGVHLLAAGPGAVGGAAAPRRRPSARP